MMWRMYCPEYEGYLREYLQGGEVGDDIGEQLREHLSGCRDCREKFYGALQRMQDMAGRVEEGIAV